MRRVRGLACPVRGPIQSVRDSRFFYWKGNGEAGSLINGAAEKLRLGGITAIRIAEFVRMSDLNRALSFPDA